MKVRVARACYQPLYPRGPNVHFREHQIGQVVDWRGDKNKLPKCFETLDMSRVQARKRADQAAEAAAQAAEVARAAEAEASEAMRAADNLEAEGDVGSEDPFVPPPTPKGDEMLDREGQIRAAEDMMDHGDDNQWTVTKEPLVEAVAQNLAKLGFNPDTSRAEIQVANPEFLRNEV